MQDAQNGPRALTLYLDVDAESPELVRWEQASDFGFGVAVPADFASLLLRLLTESLESNRAMIVEDETTVAARKRAPKAAAKPEPQAIEIENAEVQTTNDVTAAASKPKRKASKKQKRQAQPQPPIAAASDLDLETAPDPASA